MLITVEGIDGSGKSTTVDAIAEEHPKTIVTAEPSTLWTGEQVRRCLSDDTIDPLTDFYFFMGDRVHHIEETVRPLDERGLTVVSDRYADSTRAYQPVALANSGHFDSQTTAKIFIEQAMKPWDYEPDMTIYLDISVDTAIERSDGREKYERREFLEAVKQNYDALVEENPDRFVVIDGEQSKEEVRRAAIEKIDRKI